MGDSTVGHTAPPGDQLKYSSAFWPADAMALDQAEAAGLRESCLHGDLMNGQTILELGCG